ncbi:rap1 GTPase-GDP dissociation stimulator 1 isoform X3, partial [Tachysurus ichikawai]
MSLAFLFTLFETRFLNRSVLADNLDDALKTLKLSSVDSASDSVESCLDCLLKALVHN